MSEIQENILVIFSLIMLIINYIVVRLYLKDKHKLQEEIDNLNFELSELKSSKDLNKE